MFRILDIIFSAVGNAAQNLKINVPPKKQWR
jgi:hypothetical protein